MKRSEVRKFVAGYLSHKGATVTECDSGLLEISAPPEGESQPRANYTLAFGRKAYKQHPEAELVAIGSAYLDQLVSEATASGHRFICYQSLPDCEPMKPSTIELPKVANATWSQPKQAYRPLFLFMYVAEYRTIDVADDLELIPLDPVRGEMLPSAGPLLEGLKTLSREPEKGLIQLSTIPSPGNIKRSLALLDRRLQRRTRKVKEAASLEIARETANIEAYYRQLIDEIRHPVGRSRLSPELEDERVRSLQLDWKRRVQEVALFWEAGASVRLSTLGVVMEPCWAFQLRGKGTPRGGRGRGPVYLAAEYASGELIETQCPICHAVISDHVDWAGNDLVCAKHLDEIDQNSTVNVDAL